MWRKQYWGLHCTFWATPLPPSTFREWYFILQIPCIPSVANRHGLIVWPFSANTPVRWFESKWNYSHFLNHECFWNSTASWFILQSSPAIIPLQHLICFKFKFTRTVRALMVAYLLSEDKRPSGFLKVFYICKEWHNISDDSLFPAGNSAWEKCLCFQTFTFLAA